MSVSMTSPHHHAVPLCVQTLEATNHHKPCLIKHRCRRRPPPRRRAAPRSPRRGAASTGRPSLYSPTLIVYSRTLIEASLARSLCDCCYSWCTRFPRRGACLVVHFPDTYAGAACGVWRAACGVQTACEGCLVVRRADRVSWLRHYRVVRLKMHKGSSRLGPTRSHGPRRIGQSDSDDAHSLTRTDARSLTRTDARSLTRTTRAV
jgi:hypothetical protein